MRDNFLIRGTRFNQGVRIRHLRNRGADIVGDPTQARCVAIDARAPLCDGGIVARVDAVSLGAARDRPLQQRRGAVHRMRELERRQPNRLQLGAD